MPRIDPAYFRRLSINVRAHRMRHDSRKWRAIMAVSSTITLDSHFTHRHGCQTDTGAAARVEGATTRPDPRRARAHADGSNHYLGKRIRSGTFVHGEPEPVPL